MRKGDRADQSGVRVPRFCRMYPQGTHGLIQRDDPPRSGAGSRLQGEFFSSGGYGDQIALASISRCQVGRPRTGEQIPAVVSASSRGDDRVTSRVP